MGVVVSKKKSSSKSINSGQSSKHQQQQNSCLNKNKKSNVSMSSSHESSFLQQPQASFDKHSIQSYTHNDTMTSIATSPCRDSIIIGKNAYNDVESISENIHQTNSFYLPDDWDSKEYQYNVS